MLLGVEARDQIGELVGECAAGHDKVGAFVACGLEEVGGDVRAKGDDGDGGVESFGSRDEGQGIIAQVQVDDPIEAVHEAMWQPEYLPIAQTARQ